MLLAQPGRTHEVSLTVQELVQVSMPPAKPRPSQVVPSKVVPSQASGPSLLPSPHTE
jgi:hypothetical protein